MKQFAICIHDLKLSDNEKILHTISSIRDLFGSVPVTLHLIIDADPAEYYSTFGKLRQEVIAGDLEIVYHGAMHKCPAGTARLFSWYHKNNAEFLGKYFNTGLNTNRYNRLNDILTVKTGICPPCWVASRSGWRFLKSIAPLYLEKLLSFYSGEKFFFSLPVSLATDKQNELYFLKKLASLIASAAIFIRHTRLRLVIHTIDMSVADSLRYLSSVNSKLVSKGYNHVLQKDLFRQAKVI